MKYRFVKEPFPSLSPPLMAKDKLVCEYYDSWSMASQKELCAKENKNCGCVKDNLCWLLLSEKDIKKIHDKDKKWAVQNLQSDNRITQQIAKFILQ